MRPRRGLAFLLTTALLPAASPKAADLAAPAPPAIERWKLANGLRVLATSAGTGPVEIRIAVDAGWGRDPEGASGTAELTAGTLTWGSAARPMVQTRQTLQELGAAIGAEIGRDEAVIRLTVPAPDALEPGLQLLADALRAPEFPAYGLEAVAARLTAATLNLRHDPGTLAERALPVLGHGPGDPAAGLPDPWRVRGPVSDAVRLFHARHYRPEATVLVVAGAPVATVRELATRLLGAWNVIQPPPGPRPAAALAAEAGPIGLVVSERSATRLLFGLGGGPATADPIARHLLARLLAQAVGRPQAIAAPFPASGFETLSLSSPEPARTLEQLLATLERIARRGPEPTAFGDAAAGLAAGLEASLPDRDFLATWLAFAELDGVPLVPARAVAAVTAATVQREAARLHGQTAWRAVALGPASLASSLSAVARTAVVELPPGADDATRRDERRGREIVAAAIEAQGGAERLRAIAHLEQRSEGVFHGTGVEVDIRWRLLVSPPSRVYLESLMTQHGRGIVTRVADGKVWTDRSKIGSAPAEPVREPVLLRQALRHPALALIRPHDRGLLRWVGEEPGDPHGTMSDVVEALDPVVGVSRLWIRRSDRAMVRIRWDLAPLESSSEDHHYADFAFFDGVRVPVSEEVLAREAPLWTLCHTTVAFPEEIEPAIYTTPGLGASPLVPTPGPMPVDRQK